MIIEYEVTEGDYIDFNIYNMLKGNGEKLFRFYRFFGAIFIVGMSYLILKIVNIEISWGWFSIIALGGGVAWILLYPLTYKASLKSYIKNLTRRNKISVFLGKKTLEIGEKDITVKGESVTEVCLPEAIKEIKVYDNLILLYNSGISAEIIPRRCLDKDIEEKFLSELKKIVKTN